MNIDVLNLGPMDNCTYLLNESGKALLIDPAWDMNFIEHTLKTKNLELVGVFFTHGHFDHVKFAQNLLESHNLKAYLEQNDVPLAGIDENFLHTYQGSQTFNIGPFTIQAIHTPGHTAGCVSLLIGDTVFTGDTLFPGACGRVDLPSSNPREMRKSLVTLSKLPQDTIVYAGHSYAGKCRTTIATERINNPFMRNAIRDEERL